MNFKETQIIRGCTGISEILDGVTLSFFFLCFVLFCNQLHQEAEVSNLLKDQANINAVWASAIIEECTRLGLTVS